MDTGRDRAKKSTRGVVILAFEDVTLSDISGPADVFALANRYFLPVEAQPYDVIVASIAGGSIRTSSGIRIETTALADVGISAADTLIVSGGGPPQAPPIPPEPIPSDQK